MNYAKKLLCLLLAICMLLSIAGCKKPATTDPTLPTGGTTAPTTPTTPTTPTAPTVHTHSYGDWQTDKQNHWMLCACGEKGSFASHFDENADEKCDFCTYAMPLQAAPLATADQMKHMVCEKTASAGGAVTAHPGGRITYRITITNHNTAALSVNVTDTLPANTLFVSGCENVSGSALSWNVKRIEPGKKVVLTYQVQPDYTIKQVRESKTDIILTNTPARVMDMTVAAPAKDIYVLETFNATDIRRIEMAIDALVTANLTAYNSSKQQHHTVALASMMYTVGFSTGLGMPTDPEEILTLIFEKAGENAGGGSSGSGEENAVKATNLLDRVAPTLFGGTAVPAGKDSLFRGSRAAEVKISDLISGDLIFVKNETAKVYIVDGQQLVELGEKEVTRAIDPGTVLPGLTASRQFAVLRPSINLNTHYSLENDEYFNDADKAAYSDLEKALIATAEAFLLRGDRTQYTDDNTGKSMYRWETSVRQPEDYTVDQYGYTNCAAFTHDVHWTTYGVAPKAGYEGNSLTLNTTRNLANSASVSWDPETLKGGNKSTVFYFECPIKTDTNGQVVSLLSDAEKEAIMQQYCSLLRPGDIICYRYTAGTSGHAMLYVGNGLIIHSSGSNYSNDNKTDTHEASIRFMSVSELFDPNVNARRYMFTNERFCIVRPQNNTTAKISANTANRVENMQGIIGEKVSSTAMGKTVNPGDKVTYSFYLFNTTAEDRQVVITDTLSNQATFVPDPGNSWLLLDDKLYLDTVVPANTRVCVQYTLQVKADAPANTKLDGAKATVNGVVHKCYDTVVANTLTAEQQQKLVDAVNTVKGMDVSGLNAVQIANLIYKTAFGVDNIFGEKVQTYGDLLNGNEKNNVGIFNNTISYTSNAILCITDANPSNGAKMVAPGMYGGHNVYTSGQAGETYFRYLNLADRSLRSRYYWEKDLVVGDLYLLKATSQESLYIYIGNDTFVSLGGGHTLFSELSVKARFAYTPATVWKYHAVLRPSMVLDI